MGKNAGFTISSKQENDVQNHASMCLRRRRKEPIMVQTHERLRATNSKRRDLTHNVRQSSRFI